MSKKKKIWKEIDGFNGKYLISNYGEVKSLKREQPKILRPFKKHPKAPYTVGLYSKKEKKTIVIELYKLFSDYFPNEKMEVDPHMRELYYGIGNGDPHHRKGTPVYLADGVYINEDGSMFVE